MLSFYSQKGSKPIAVNKEQLLYISDDEKLDKNSVTSDEDLCMLPPVDKHREIIYVCGPSGSGKSTITAEYVSNYSKLHPKHDIFLFSMVADDPAFEKLKKKIHRIQITDNLLEQPVELSELNNTLVVFDDVDGIPDKKLYNAVTNLVLRIAEHGRHNNITMILISHLVNGVDMKKTRVIMNECSRIVLFPKAMNRHQLDYFLKKYIGMHQKDIDEFNRIKSRAVIIGKNYPRYVLYKTGAYCI